MLPTLNLTSALLPQLVLDEEQIPQLLLHQGLAQNSELKSSKAPRPHSLTHHLRVQQSRPAKVGYHLEEV